MHIYILGIAGTFMSGIALLAKQLGHQVSGMDANIYPPISEQLVENNIDFTQGYEVKQLPKADLFIIGNALSRGNICVEEILNRQYRYTSGAQWLSDNILKDKWVLAVSGTHGKTTTSAMLTWILEQANLNPSYLVGGVMNNFPTSARLTDSLFFVIEADEYDTAFFDKRSKFVHYCPNTLIINNLEFDHADIFDSLADIQKQFHHLIRLVPNNGLIIYPDNSPSIEAVIKQGVWSPIQTYTQPSVQTNQQGTIINITNDLSLRWQLLGKHNANNAMSALMAAQHAGVPLAIAVEALNGFNNVKRRLEIIYQANNITVYDDFAHHPTAIATTLEALRQQSGTKFITAIIELRSNTMKLGFHQQTLINALDCANQSYLYSELDKTNQHLKKFIDKDSTIKLSNNIEDIINQCLNSPSQIFVIMSNGNFNNLSHQLIKSLSSRQT